MIFALMQVALRGHATTQAIGPMDLTDLDKLLQPLSDDEPCGPDLEYDADFGEMDRAAQAKPEQQYGNTIVAAEEPDWKDVKRRAESLLERTKDMRVVVLLARATLHQEGFVGFERCLHLLRKYVETFWDTVHPELDADDDNDPTYRTNTLITLCDDDTTLREIREAPIVSSRAVGRFSFRDIEKSREAAEAASKPAPKQDDDDWSSGSQSEASDEPKGPSPATIDAAFTDAAVEDIQATEEATRLAAEHLAEIERQVTEHVGVNLAVSLASPRNLLNEINQLVAGQLKRRGVGIEPEPTEADEAAGSDDGVATGAVSQTGAVAASPMGYVGGKIATRQQAIQALADVCDYYETNEPSSPLPLLIRRAQRLSSASFLDILRDVAPDAVSQAEALSGGVASVPSDTSESNSSSESSSDDSW
ncbi:type VI secretion system protein TssA [Stieleria sp. JC731]|uniref:type VI secretion system protein TssA n=1 Tax=Pirellulaceae TaxID=2691357 RepID=UPI001E5E6C5C|nr:type VI secretion system protein TssA [Stieleria sp. JC731]MCC9601132.1 type VI secretion system protein TssA [Stieleria sp. JC731]